MSLEVCMNQLARDLGVSAGSIRRGKGLGYVLLIDCKECPAPVEFAIHKGFPPEVMAKKIKGRGWSTKPLLCPKHAAANVLKRRNQPKGEPKMPSVTAPIEPQPTDPTAAAKAAQRNVLRWLDEAFSADTGAYTGGVSDATIATETGVSKEAVAKLREQFFGPLKAPTEWASMWNGLDEIANRVDDFEREAVAVVQQVRSDLGAFKAQLTRAAKNGGWQV